MTPSADDDLRQVTILLGLAAAKAVPLGRPGKDICAVLSQIGEHIRAAQRSLAADPPTADHAPAAATAQAPCSEIPCASGTRPKLTVVRDFGTSDRPAV